MSMRKTIRCWQQSYCKHLQALASVVWFVVAYFSIIIHLVKLKWSTCHMSFDPVLSVRWTIKSWFILNTPNDGIKVSESELIFLVCFHLKEWSYVQGKDAGNARRTLVSSNVSMLVCGIKSVNCSQRISYVMLTIAMKPFSWNIRCSCRCHARMLREIVKFVIITVFMHQICWILE